jgi:hypothetical protein
MAPCCSLSGLDDDILQSFYAKSVGGISACIFLVLATTPESLDAYYRRSMQSDAYPAYVFNGVPMPRWSLIVSSPNIVSHSVEIMEKMLHWMVIPKDSLSDDSKAQLRVWCNQNANNHKVVQCILQIASKLSNLEEIICTMGTRRHERTLMRNIRCMTLMRNIRPSKNVIFGDIPDDIMDSVLVKNHLKDSIASFRQEACLAMAAPHGVIKLMKALEGSGIEHDSSKLMGIVDCIRNDGTVSSYLGTIAF